MTSSSSSSPWSQIQLQVLPVHSTAASSTRSWLVLAYSLSVHCVRELSLPLQLILYPLSFPPGPNDPKTLTGSPQFISLHTTAASFIPQLTLYAGDHWPLWWNSTLPEHEPLPLISLMVAGKQRRENQQLVGVWTLLKEISG